MTYLIQKAVRAGLVKFALLTGAADSATAGITCTAGDGTAITLNDLIIGAIELAVTTNVWTDRSASCEIITGGKVTVPNSENDKVAVFWLARDAGLQVDSPFVASGIGTGALANVSIPVTGILTTDDLIAVIEVNTASGAWTDRTAASSIYTDGNVRCTSSTNGNTIYVLWMDQSGPRGFSAFHPRFYIGTIDTSPTTDPSSATVTGVDTTDKILSVLCVDETDYDILNDLTVYTTIAAADTVTIDEPSPTATSGAKLLVFVQKGVD